MEYCKIQDNVCIELYDSMPEYYLDSVAIGNKLSQSQLIEYMNIFVVNPVIGIPNGYDDFKDILVPTNIDQWVIDSINSVIIKQYTIDSMTLEEKKLQIITELGIIRYEHEIGGVNTPFGIVATDRSSQSMLNAALMIVRDDPTKEIRWKMENSWSLLTATMIEQLSVLVVDHVEGCFDNEYVIWNEIDSAISFTELMVVDINSGW